MRFEPKPTEHFERITLTKQFVHALLEQAASIEIAYGPSIWQLVRNLLTWGTPLSEEEGSVQMTVPVGALPELAKHFAR